MNDYTIENILRELLTGCPIEDTDLGEEGVSKICTYEEGGYLTYDRGLVLRTADGSEFQITIIQTR